jgi:hypothetical protein
MLLGPSDFAILFLRVFVAPFLQDFPGNTRKFGDSGSTERKTFYYPQVMKERGETELSAVFLGDHLIVDKRLWNSRVVLKSLVDLMF